MLLNFIKIIYTPFIKIIIKIVRKIVGDVHLLRRAKR